MHSKKNEYIELYFSLISAVSQAKVIIKSILIFKASRKILKKWISQYSQLSFEFMQTIKIQLLCL